MLTDDPPSDGFTLDIVFIPGSEPCIPFTIPWFMLACMLACICSCSCFTIGPVGWQGLPSRTRTGTATRRGDGKGFMSNPFSWRARFILYLWFWNHIFTCVGLSRIMLAKCSLSGAERYLCCRKRRSSSYVCALENNTLRFRFFCESPFCCGVWQSPLWLLLSSSPLSLDPIRGLMSTGSGLSGMPWDRSSAGELATAFVFRCPRSVMQTPRSSIKGLSYQEYLTRTGLAPMTIFI